MPPDLASKFISRTREDGLVEAWKRTLRYSIRNSPVLHHLSVVEYLSSPGLEHGSEITQSHNHFWLDRYLELQRFSELSHTELLSMYVKLGFPNHANWSENCQRNLGIRERLERISTSTGPDELMEIYRLRHTEIVNRLMLGYHRYDIAEMYLELTDENVPLENVSVLDYGCGVADPSLYLAALGADPTIVDLQNQTFEFARERFENRDLDVTAVGATQTNVPVDVPSGEFDFIIMSEFLEHVRDPEAFLTLAIDRLPSGGILFDPVGRNYTHSVGGDHLPEAKETVESDEYQELHRGAFERAEGDYWMRK